MHELRLAFPSGIKASNTGLQVQRGSAALSIELTDLPFLSIGALRLARLKVGIRGTAGTMHEQKTLLAHMDLAMQRGGG